MSAQSVYLKTFGCQMNEYDSENILRLLASLDYEPTADPGEADLILVNTCSVREKSEQKFYSFLGRLKQYRKEGKVLLGVGGCVAQQEGERLLHKVPYVDLIFGTSTISRLPELIENAKKTGAVQIATEFRDEFHPVPGAGSSYSPKVKAQVTIMKGCDNFCSFCVVPYVRGREKSRPSKEIIAEVKHLVQSGIKEVMLLGQNVNSYGNNGKEEMSFPGLLREIHQIERLRRIRFTTSHPKDLSEDLVTCYKELEKLCPHIHLPLQSGSDRILKMMNRGYTKKEYLSKVNQLRNIRPDIGITTDLIAGFPGETEKDFQETLEVIDEVQYDDFFSFKYSDRQFTRASRYSHKLSEEEKVRRLSILQEKQKTITRRKNEQLVGQRVEVLVEGQSKKNAQRLTGRSGTNKVVNFKGPWHLTGEVIEVKILEAYFHSLLGEVI